MKNIRKPNPSRSKRNPKGERNDLPINWSNHNKGRKSEGKYHIKWMAKIADMVHDIMGMPQAKHDWKVSSILVAIVKS